MTNIGIDTFRVLDGAALDESTRRVEVHVHHPYVSTTFNANDEIRIPVQQQDAYILPHLSCIYIEGRFITGGGGGGDDGGGILTNNALSFLLDDVRYEINGVEVDRTKNVGITSTMKGIVSLNENEVRALENAGWTTSGDGPAHVLDENGNFNVCIPAKILLGFLEDYHKVLLNVRHELILNRAKNDRNAIRGGNANTRIELSKIHWRVPYVYPSDLERLNLLKILENENTLQMCFRSWELYEYPLLPQATKQTWAVKTTTQLEKPRYVLVAFQTSRKGNQAVDSSLFDHCNLTNIKLYLNSESFPYENLNVDFATNKYALLYEMYENFQCSYYGKVNEPLYGREQFKNRAPIVVIDASKQTESVKSGPVDIRLEFESNDNFPPNTTAYCLILHDRIVEYTPSNGSIKRLV